MFLLCFAREKMEIEPLKDKVYKTLRYDILTGKIPGGSHITESAMAKQLDVSRTPVREALQRLTQEKLITSLPRAGYLIENMSDEDIQDLFSARFDIETLVIKKAVQYITAEELNLMADNIERTKACILSGELRRMTDLDLEFHAIIYQASRSKTFYRICRNLGDLTMKYRHGLNLVRDLWKAIVETHTMIYTALLERDEQKAVQAIARHGDQAKAQLMEIMKRLRSESFVRNEI
jgi:DNA-binding GntR family transcriptional regulator